jgi:hypothetical protein
LVTRFLPANLLLPSLFLSLAIMRTAAAATVTSQVGTMPSAQLMSDFMDKHKMDTARNDAGCHETNIINACIKATNTQDLVSWSDVQPVLW